MPVVVNTQTGLAENLDDAQAAQALKGGSHSLPMNDPEGNPITATLEDAPRLVKQGYSQPNPDQLQNLVTYAEKSSPTQQAITAAEGAGRGMTLGLSTSLERLFGVNPEDIRLREEVNPGVAALGEMGGLGVSMLYGAGELGAARLGLSGTQAAVVGGAGRALSGAGNAVAKLAGLGEATGFVGGVGRGLVKGAVESAMMSAGDEFSGFMASDPNQSVETAMSHIQANALLGGALGGGMSAAFGAPNLLWKKISGGKTGQLLEDFKARVSEHIHNPNPGEAVKSELKSYYDNVTGLHDEVFGSTGLKADAIAKHAPAMNEKIATQTQDLSNKLNSSVNELTAMNDTLAPKFKRAIEKWEAKVTAPEVASSEVFEASNQLKKQLQEWSKFEKRAGIAEQDFVNTAKSMGSTIKTALEDTAVWGDAGKAQAKINSAFAKWFPALKDFNKTFTRETAVEGRFIDPQRVETYMNQLGKPNAEIKQSAIANFRKSSDHYVKELEDIYSSMGIDSPFTPTSLNAVDATLGEVSHGAKLADTLIKKGLAKAGASAIGTGVGGLLGGGWGAYAGEKLSSALLESVLPGLAKAMLDKAPSAAGMKAAIDMGMAIRKGEMLLNSGARAIFQKDKQVIPESLRASEGKIARLKTRIDELQKDPTPLLEVGGDTGHYMPEHGVALGATAARAVTYLQTLKPIQDPAQPLDSRKKVNGVQEGKYNRALQIVQQPMTAVVHLKDGRITSDDMKTLSAVYPGWLARMQQKVTTQMIEHQSKGHLIPYQTRLGLSVFLGMPLDSTMTPAAMQLLKPQDPNQQQQAPGGGPATGKANQSGMNKMGKANVMNMTPNQQSQARGLQ